MSSLLHQALYDICDEKVDLKSQFIVSHRHISEEWGECLCGQRIKEFCYITHRKTGNNFIVGNVCIKQFGFMPNCTVCDIYPIQSFESKYCIYCKKQKTRIVKEVKFGKYKGKSYSEVLTKDPQYCAWARENMSGDQHFVEWLKRKHAIGTVKRITSKTTNKE